MTLRLNSSHRSGSRQIHSSRKKRVKFAAMSSPCWSFFSTSKAFSKRNLYSLVKLSMASFTVRFWSSWGRAFGANVQTSGRNNWFLHHDNTPAHTSLVVQQFLTSKSITVIPHPSYSPDLAPCNIFLFPMIKLRLKGHRFDTTEEIHAEMQEVINILTFQNFQGCIKTWETRSNRCIHAQGGYVEGDSGNQELW